MPGTFFRRADEENGSMKHVGRISRLPAPAQFGFGGPGNLDPAESLVILLLTAFFQDWVNYRTVIQNLQKYYAKT
jgi:hypothetical protein